MTQGCKDAGTGRVARAEAHVLSADQEGQLASLWPPEAMWLSEGGPEGYSDLFCGFSQQITSGAQNLGVKTHLKHAGFVDVAIAWKIISTWKNNAQNCNHRSGAGTDTLKSNLRHSRKVPMSCITSETELIIYERVVCCKRRMKDSFSASSSATALGRRKEGRKLWSSFWFMPSETSCTLYVCLFHTGYNLLDYFTWFYVIKLHLCLPVLFRSCSI